jgi:hypothetical protein
MRLTVCKNESIDRLSAKVLHFEGLCLFTAVVLAVCDLLGMIRYIQSRRSGFQVAKKTFSIL